VSPSLSDGHVQVRGVGRERLLKPLALRPQPQLAPLWPAGALGPGFRVNGAGVDRDLKFSEAPAGPGRLSGWKSSAKSRAGRGYTPEPVSRVLGRLSLAARRLRLSNGSLRFDASGTLE
jgi:hypothetical protein